MTSRQVCPELRGICYTCMCVFRLYGYPHPGSSENSCEWFKKTFNFRHSRQLTLRRCSCCPHRKELPFRRGCWDTRRGRRCCGFSALQPLSRPKKQERFMVRMGSITDDILGFGDAASFCYILNQRKWCPDHFFSAVLPTLFRILQSET
ncbi:hypothetical protein GOODEAATRI_004807 [Goodea atripinnis]|uniref:Uncharacterized protein n=1 Tax=Goodea atripinnis TaxID=208336 RepID=A0ABV0PLF0_9TELE